MTFTSATEVNKEAAQLRAQGHAVKVRKIENKFHLEIVGQGRKASAPKKGQDKVVAERFYNLDKAKARAVYLREQGKEVKLLHDKESNSYLVKVS